ncbi:MAG: polyprenyl synthetase family protein [Planctomycetota bacterium]
MTQAKLEPALLAPVDEIEAFMAAELDRAAPAAPLGDAMRHASLDGGKRLRPLLCWHTAAAIGGNPHACLPPAAALEFVHAFSLVHDDLPAMDDDDLRRGKPTLHIHAGEDIAILAGDALLSLAYDTITHRVDDPHTAVALVRELAAGTAGMIDGQTYDIRPDLDAGLPADATDADRLERIHRCKTGALLRAACRMGAIAAEADTSLVDAAGRFGDQLGLMFQAVDDLIDVEQPPETAGKQTGKDQHAGKLTYPAVHGIDATRRIIADLEAAALAELDRFDRPAALRSLVAYMARRDR